MAPEYYETREESIASSYTKPQVSYVESTSPAMEGRLKTRHSTDALGTVEKYYVDGKQRLIPVPTSDPLGN